VTAASLSDKRHLLAMIGGAAPPGLSDDKWAVIDAMAAQHRLQPLLAWRTAQARAPWMVPAATEAGWSEALEIGRLVNLALLAGLRLAGEVLTKADIKFTALKGPRLAWHGYPEAALRPMRDLDLLVPEKDARRAEEVLCGAGFESDRSEAALREALADHQHLPPLWHPGLKIRLELHHRLTDPPARHGYRVPQLDAAQVIAASETLDLSGVAVPCPSAIDLLAHLMVHALYGHRLDCGPLVLADIYFLLASEKIDGEAFKRMAASGGWLRGAELLLALTERYCGPQPLALGSSPPDEVLAIAEDLLLLDLDTREQGVALADILAARSVGALAREIGRRLKPEAHVVDEEAGGAPLWRFWPMWAARRVGRLARSLPDRRAGREARGAAALLRWLQG
jgi:hypothetical protein